MMIDFHEISRRLREVVSHIEKKEKVLDKDIAQALKLDPQYYAVIKRRNKIPYEAIALFCKKNRLSINWILLKQKPKYLT
jgi:hypothetical protein